MHTRDRPGGATGLSGRELWSRGRLPRGSARIVRELKGTGNGEALPSSRAIHGSAWPALRPRWSLSWLAYHATTDAAFRHVETVRLRESDSGSHLRFSLAGPHLSNNFRGSITHPTVSLGPASDLCLLRPTGFTTGLVASLCPGRISTSWVAKTNFYGVPTPRPKVTDLTWHDPGRIGDCSANPPTEPDVKVSLIRFLGDWKRYVPVCITLLPANTS